MYCGDETGSFVGDIGSAVSRFGYGGDDSPKYIVPSYVATMRRVLSSGTQTQEDVGVVVPAATARSRRHHQQQQDGEVYRIIPKTCYHLPGSRGGDGMIASSAPSRLEDWQPAMRLAAAAVGGDGSNGIPTTPIVDPDAFLQQGDSIANWDAYEHLWQSAFDTMHVRSPHKHSRGGGTTATLGGDLAANNNNRDQLHVSNMTSTTLRSSSNHIVNQHPCVHPLLVVSPGCTYRVGTGSATASLAAHRREMSQLTELLMETAQCPALFVAPTPMVTAFSQGRPTALVVDVGAGGCRVTPVVDGLLLHQSQRRNGRGGDWLGHITWQGMLRNIEANNRRNTDHRPPHAVLILPRYQLHRSTTQQASVAGGSLSLFHRWAIQDLMYEFRSSEHVRLAAYPSKRSYSRPLFGVHRHYQQDGDKSPTTHATSSSSSSSCTDDDVDNNYDQGEEEDDNDNTTAKQREKRQRRQQQRHSIQTTYELPDGTVLDLTTHRLGRDLCHIPELLFSNTLPFSELYSFTTTNNTTTTATPMNMVAASTTLDDGNNHNTINNSTIVHEHVTLSSSPLHRLIHESLSAVTDVDLRKDLAANIVLSGGGSWIGSAAAAAATAVTNNNGSNTSTRRLTTDPSHRRQWGRLEQRLSAELLHQSTSLAGGTGAGTGGNNISIPASYKCKVLASQIHPTHIVERSCAGWIGGSILSSLGSFQQLWLSRTEYEEYGATLSIQRFP